MSLSLDPADYAALHRVAAMQRPPLSDSYVAAYAVKKFLEAYTDSQLILNFSPKR